MSKHETTPKEPILRFPGFEEEWKEKSIQSLLDEGILVSHLDGNHGELYPTSVEFAEFGVPYISANDLVDGEVDFSRCKRLPKKRAMSFKKGVAKPGDVLFAHNATVGPTAILNSDYEYVILSTTITYFRFDTNQFENGFAYQAFNSVRFINQYSRVMSQSTRNQVPITTQRKFLIPDISLPEQKKISTFLRALDDKLAGLRKKRDQLTAYKRGAMQQIFNGKIRFKCDDGTAFPDWELKRLGTVFDRITRKNGENNKNVLTISAQQGLVNQEDYFNKSVAAADVTGYYLLHKGDFAYNKSYSKGYPMGAIKRLNGYEKGVVSTLYICFTTKQEVTARFFEQYFESGGLNRELHKIAQEGARNHGLLNLSVLEFFRDISIPLPHPNEQQKIAEFLSALDVKIDAVVDQVTQTETFKKGLLQRMFV